MVNELLIRDISMTFDDDDAIIRSVSDECDEDEAVLTRLPSHQWRDIMDFLTVEDFKALRLTGSKVSLLHAYDVSSPIFTPRLGAYCCAHCLYTHV